LAESAAPGTFVRDARSVQELRNLDQRALRELVPDASDDGGFLRHNLEFARTNKPARGIAPVAVAERVMTPMPTVLEQAPLHPVIRSQS
jgi:hypothetical protein